MATKRASTDKNEPGDKPRRGRASKPNNGEAKNGGGDLGFERTPWQAARKPRNNMDAGEDEHVALGLIFLKYISDTFEDRHAQLVAQEVGADVKTLIDRSLQGDR